jgi:hypothetical protein
VTDTESPAHAAKNEEVKQEDAGTIVQSVKVSNVEKTVFLRH